MNPNSKLVKQVLRSKSKLFSEPFQGNMLLFESAVAYSFKPAIFVIEILDSIGSNPLSLISGVI